MPHPEEEITETFATDSMLNYTNSSKTALVTDLKLQFSRLEVWIAANIEVSREKQTGIAKLIEAAMWLERGIKSGTPPLETYVQPIQFQMFQPGEGIVEVPSSGVDIPETDEQALDTLFGSDKITNDKETKPAKPKRKR